jgi:hypothetical protein
MTMSNQKFDYLIDEAAAWPPRRRPKPPFGPTELEIMRSCPLRSCFEASPGYERRLGFAARIGSAFHRTLQSFSQQPLPPGPPDHIAAESRHRFERELQAQSAEAASRPREAGLPRDQTRVDYATEAAVAEALRLASEGSISLSHIPTSETNTIPSPKLGQGSGEGVDFNTRPPEIYSSQAAVEIEVSVQSDDGLFRGRVDRAERGPQGVRLVDYKSALRGDLPGRYERQVQLYAYLWQQTRGEWPTAGLVLYPLTATTHPVTVEPAVCQQLAAEAATMITRVQTEPSLGNLALPGEVCQVCDFRPWCRPFWQWQAAEPSQTEALQRARLGFQGKLTRLELINHTWRLSLAWRKAEVRLVAPEERFPQLKRAQVGTLLRVLDTALRGLRHQPQAVVSEVSEVFVVFPFKE